MANYNEGTRFNDSSAKSYFNPELKAESFKLNSDGAKVKYQGISVTSEGKLSKSKLHHVMARVMTPVTALFERYKSTITINQEGTGGAQFHRGSDLKDRIVDFTKNLKDVSRVIKEKEANIETLTHSLEVYRPDGRVDHRSAWIRELESEKKELAALKEEWKTVKSNVEDLKNGLKDSYFGASTVLVKLNRAERKVEKALHHADEKVKQLDTTMGSKIETIKREKQDNLIADNRRAIAGLTFQARRYINSSGRDLVARKELAGIRDQLKALETKISSQDDQDNLAKASDAHLLVGNILNYLESINLMYESPESFTYDFEIFERCVEHCNKPELEDNATAVAFKTQIKKDLEVIQQKLEGSEGELPSRVNRLLASI